MKPAPDVNSVAERPTTVACCHCGTACPEPAIASEDLSFCCTGCLAVYDILQQAGLGQFYDLESMPGIRVPTPSDRDRFAYLDDPSLRHRLLDCSDGATSRVTFHVPAMHCVACIWLLENLFRLEPGMVRSRVNFPRREVTVWYTDAILSLSEVVTLLASLGYEPVLQLAQLDEKHPPRAPRRLLLQLAVAGFAFGNIMLFSLPAYFGMTPAQDGILPAVFGWLSLLLSLPVLFYSAADYFTAAWRGLRRQVISLDVPIALGALALWLQSTFDIVLHRGEGYLDSFAGLIFLLLCGKFMQRKTYDRLSFDRDYKAYFPLSVLQLTDNGEHPVPVTHLRIGDRIRIRHGELIPADGILEQGEGRIDYSFVTGEADPVDAGSGEYVYAGGRQRGGSLDLRVAQEVSQSYLTSLWNDEAFAVEAEPPRESPLIRAFSRTFTGAVLTIACLTGIYWMLNDPSLAVRTFSAVLIVACPCALALASPFTLGAALRIFGRRGLYLRDASVIDGLADIDTIVFDKTGTLTLPTDQNVAFDGSALDPDTAAAVRALCLQSVHPYSARIATALTAEDRRLHPSKAAALNLEPAVPGRIFVESSAITAENRRLQVDDVAEFAKNSDAPEKGSPDRSKPTAENRRLPVDHFVSAEGAGLAGHVGGRDIVLGSASWLQTRGIPSLPPTGPDAAAVHLAIDGAYRGAFHLSASFRPRLKGLLDRLGGRFGLHVLSGDNDRELPALRHQFPAGTEFSFRHDPADKLAFIRRLEADGRSVLMIGDGLNDAGALAAGRVGLAVTEDLAAFSPASDGILSGARLTRLDDDLALGRATRRVIRICIAISILYNVVGISFAARGALSPLVCAVLMPLSSITVVSIAVGLTAWYARRSA